MFSIVRVCVGVISVRRTLDGESVSVYHLNVSAHDSGAPAMTSEVPATLHVYVTNANDNAPVFTRRIYTAAVNEEQDAPVDVITVSATDFDQPTSNQSHACLSVAVSVCWPQLRTVSNYAFSNSCICCRKESRTLTTRSNCHALSLLFLR